MRQEFTTGTPDPGRTILWDQRDAQSGVLETSFEEVRFARVFALRRRIAEGTYFVPASELADCLIRRLRRS